MKNLSLVIFVILFIGHSVAVVLSSDANARTAHQSHDVNSEHALFSSFPGYTRN